MADLAGVGQVRRSLEGAGGGYGGGGGADADFDSGAGGGGSFLSPLASHMSQLSGVEGGNGFVEIIPVILVVAKGDPAPGIPSGQFLLADNPAVDSTGDVAFKAFISATGSGSGIDAANKAGVWLYTGGTNGSLVAREDAPAPGTSGAIFRTISDPVIDGSGSLGYAGTLGGGDVLGNQSNAAGLWLVQNGNTTLFARKGANAAGQQAAAYAAIPQFANEEPNGLTFLATLAGPDVSSQSGVGLFGTDLSGSAATVLRAGDSMLTGTATRTVKSLSAFGTAADEKGQSRSVDTVNGNLSFIEGNTDKTSSIVLATPGASGFALSTLATTSSDSMPGIASARWAAFGNPIVNQNADVAFRATVQSTSSSVKITGADSAGIWLSSAGGVHHLSRVQALPRLGSPAHSRPFRIQCSIMTGNLHSSVRWHPRKV